MILSECYGWFGSIWVYYDWFVWKLNCVRGMEVAWMARMGLSGLMYFISERSVLGLRLYMCHDDKRGCIEVSSLSCRTQCFALICHFVLTCVFGEF